MLNFFSGEKSVEPSETEFLSLLYHKFHNLSIKISKKIKDTVDFCQKSALWIWKLQNIHRKFTIKTENFSANLLIFYCRYDIILKWFDVFFVQFKQITVKKEIYKIIINTWGAILWRVNSLSVRLRQ